MRCIDCFFFTNPLIGGRDLKSCQELGELASNNKCSQFKSKNSTKEGILNVLNDFDSSKPIDPTRPDNFDYSKEIVSILSESFQIERGLDVAIDTIKIQLGQVGSQGDLKQILKLKTITDKLTDIMVIHRLCLTFGLAPYVGEIVTKVIDNKFTRIKEETKEKKK